MELSRLRLAPSYEQDMAQASSGNDEMHCTAEEMDTERGSTTPMSPLPRTVRGRTPIPKMQLCEWKNHLVTRLSLIP